MNVDMDEVHVRSKVERIKRNVVHVNLRPFANELGRSKGSELTNITKKCAPFRRG